MKSRLTARDRITTLVNRARCAVGIHRLKAWHAHKPEHGGDAYQMPPRALPGPGDHRRCDWCGARWVGAYDFHAPFWQREWPREARAPIDGPPPTTRADGALNSTNTERSSSAEAGR